MSKRKCHICDRSICITSKDRFYPHGIGSKCIMSLREPMHVPDPGAVVNIQFGDGVQQELFEKRVVTCTYIGPIHVWFEGAEFWGNAHYAIRRVGAGPSFEHFTLYPHGPWRITG